ncbi:MAG: hemerythrin family protein, partial [Dehalococcoidia bacterium]
MSIEWSDDYLIGIDEIDKQHKELHTKLQELYDKVLLCEGENDIQDALNFLKNYAITHFQTEEAFMRKHKYPNIGEHLKLHTEFLDEYSKLSDEFKELGSNQELVNNITDMVKNWLSEHIADADTDYARYI